MKQIKTFLAAFIVDPPPYQISSESTHSFRDAMWTDGCTIPIMC